MATYDLSGKRALVTGGGTGIGRAIALILAQSGATVLVSGRRKEPLEETVSAMGSGAFCTGDVSQEQDVKALMASVKEQLGGLDVLVNNAGIFQRGPLAEASTEDLRRMYEVNLLGPSIVTREALPLLLESAPGSSVIMVSSTLGERPLAGTASYCASKAGLNLLAQSLALETAESGIRVNVVSPGLVRTPIHENYLGAEKMQTFDADFSGAQPLGRVGQPVDIAEAVAFLASDASSWTTGAILNVDGGVALV